MVVKEKMDVSDRERDSVVVTRLTERNGGQRAEKGLTRYEVIANNNEFKDFMVSVLA